MTSDSSKTCTFEFGPKDIEKRWIDSSDFRFWISSGLVQVGSSPIVDRAGFEPAASALRRRRSCQTDLPARLRKRSFTQRVIMVFGIHKDRSFLVWAPICAEKRESIHMKRTWQRRLLIVKFSRAAVIELVTSALKNKCEM